MDKNEELDRLRSKIGINRLEATQRKKLFREFVDHGGQVVERNTIAKTDALKRREHLTGDRKPGETPGDRRSPPQGPSSAKSPERQDAAKPAHTAELKASPKARRRIRLSELVHIYTRGIVLKVLSLRWNRLSDTFVDYMHRSVKESFIDLSISMDSILKGDGSIRKDIYRLSIGENSTFYEFMVRMNALFNEKEFTEIERAVASRTVPKPHQLAPFKQLLLRLYVLGQFPDLCKLYIDKALEIQSRHGKINPDLVPSMRAQLRKDINIILGEFIHKLHLLVCRIDRCFYPLYSQKLDDFLGITEKDKVGYITREERKKRIEQLKRQKEYMKKQQEEIHGRERAEVKPPKHVERGFPLLEAAAKRHAALHESDADDPMRLMSMDDKMFRVCLYFDVFENEYSFILTTGKLGFNIDYREQKKVDIKEDLGNAYLHLSASREEVKDYIEIMKEIHKTRENMRLTVNQKSSMLETLSKKQSVLSRSARSKIADAMKAVENTLSVVISDYNSSKRLLKNPDEALFFDKSIDGDKKLHGKKSIEAIVETFLFSSTFAFLLTFGELSGSGLAVEPLHVGPGVQYPK
jgi:hypothetical protein